ncbi:MAG: CDP-glucose 4,6-dehydratase [Betaproteobacteria bacterium]|nr:CDP-glucose 4,6-dehydratase [Betaproteobacteria bacterium]
MPSPQFWNRRRVFVTGHTGFKGAWLCHWLLRLGATVTGFSLPAETDPSLFSLTGLAQGMDSGTGDIREYQTLLAAMRRANPDIVIHLAAQSLVRRSYAQPVETYATNVMGTVHVLEAARQTGSVRAVVSITSDKCYENREWVWAYRENEPMGGHDPYSSSKGCAELVTAAYRRSFFQAPRQSAAVASGRAGNVIGGGDWAEDRLLPDCMRALLAGRPVPIRNPNAIRPWQHVLEPLAGYLALAERLWEHGMEFAEGWNFGPADEDSRPVGWIADRIVEMWGEGARWQQQEGDHPHEAHTLRVDSTKARIKLGWRPRLALADALRWTVDWYRRYHAGDDMRDFTLGQIGRYEALPGPGPRTGRGAKPCD